MIDDNEQIVESTEQPTPDAEQNVTPVETKQAEEDQVTKNHRALRLKAEKAERERDEAYKILREIEAQKQQQNKPVEEDDLGLDSEAYVEGKHLKKTYKKVQKLEEELKNYQKKNAELLVETRIKAQFPDFDQVVTKENIESLKTTYPELAHALNPHEDLYGAAASAYTLIKKLGITPQEDVYSQDRAIAQKNAAKPRSMASLAPQQGESPLSHANAFANGLTDDLKKQLWKEMEESTRNG